MTYSQWPKRLSSEICDSEGSFIFLNPLTVGLYCSIPSLKTLQEYTGIDVQRLEQMETRLKADVLREAKLHGGRLLVAREVMGSEEGQSATIVDNFIPIEGEALTDLRHSAGDSAGPGFGMCSKGMQPSA